MMPFRRPQPYRKGFPMRLTYQVAALFLALAAVAPARAADVDPYLPNDAELVISVNLEQLLNSTLGKKYLRAAVEEGLKSNGQVQEVLKYLELDPFKDINRVTVALSSAAADNGFVVVNGKFNREKIAQLAQQVAAEHKDKFKIHRDGGVAIYEGISAENKPVFASFVSDSTLLMSGDKETLRASNKIGKPKKEMIALIQKADAKQTAWIAVLPAVASALPVEDQAQKNAIDKIQGMVGSLRVDSGVRLEFNVMNQTPQAALAINRILIDLTTGLKLVAPNAIKERPELAPVFEILAAMRTLVRGNAVTVTAEMTAAQVENLAKQLIQNK
jgi:hypothetical protein